MARERRPLLALAAAFGGVMLAGLSVATPGAAVSLSSRVAATDAERPLLLPVAIFGSDDRVALPADRARLGQSIGLLYEARSRSVCTAFCVGDDLIATAGHCLFRTAGERPPRLAGFTFRLQPQGRAGPTSDIAGAQQRAAAQHVAAGTLELRVRPPIDAASDWALVRLRAPICKGRALPISRQPADQLVRLSAAQRVYQVSFHRDFGSWDLALGAPCAIRRSFGGADWKTISNDFVDPAHVILHTCDTGGASSGSPMLIDGPGGPEVVGINVGTYLQSRVLTQQGEVVHRYKSETVANTAVGAAAFRDALEAMARAEILAPRKDIRELQRLLAAEGHYRGGRDGIYGPQLNTAIRAFERAEGRSETGLATVALMRRLMARDAERRGRVPEPRPASIETGSVGSHSVSGAEADLQ